MYVGRVYKLPSTERMKELFATSEQGKRGSPFAFGGGGWRGRKEAHTPAPGAHNGGRVAGAGRRNHPSCRLRAWEVSLPCPGFTDRPCPTGGALLKAAPQPPAPSRPHPHLVVSVVGKIICSQRLSVNRPAVEAAHPPGQAAPPAPRRGGDVETRQPRLLAPFSPLCIRILVLRPPRSSAGSRAWRPPGRREAPGKAIWAPPPLTLRPGAGRPVGAAGVPRRRRRGHPRVPRCPDAQALGIWARDPGGRPAGRALSARDVRLAAPGSGRRRPAQTPPEAGAGAGREGGAAPAGPPGALGLGRGGRAGGHAAQGRPRSTCRPGPRRGSLPPARSRAPRSPALPFTTGRCKTLISLPRPLREPLSLTAPQSPHPEIGAIKHPPARLLGRSDEPMCGRSLPTRHPQEEALLFLPLQPPGSVII